LVLRIILQQLIFGVLDASLQVLLIINLEMINGKPLFTGVSETDQLKKIFKVRGTPTEKSYPDLKNLPDWNNVHRLNF